jgi:hypothetical protein
MSSPSRCSSHTEPPLRSLPQWPNDDYETIYVFRITGSGKDDTPRAALEIDPERRPGENTEWSAPAHGSKANETDDAIAIIEEAVESVSMDGGGAVVDFVIAKASQV